MPAAFTTLLSVQVSGFEDIGLLCLNTAASYAISVRRVSVLSRHGVTSFGSLLAVGTLAVRLTVPLAGPVEDFHLQIIQLPPQQLKQR